MALVFLALFVFFKTLETSACMIRTKILLLFLLSLCSFNRIQENFHIGKQLQKTAFAFLKEKSEFAVFVEA